jgi:hypothetical protein
MFENTPNATVTWPMNGGIERVIVDKWSVEKGAKVARVRRPDYARWFDRLCVTNMKNPDDYRCTIPSRFVRED